MAHLDKYHKAEVKAILNHNGRIYDGTKKRDNVHPERTPENYVLGLTDSEIEAKQLITNRIEAVKASHKEQSGRGVRKDAVLLASWVLTVPESLPVEKHREFFAKAYEFMCNRYGAENIPAAFVHVDENRPHMHTPIVPEIRGRLSFKDKFKRIEYATFHKDLQNYLEKELQCKVEVLLDESEKEKKAISQIDRDLVDDLDPKRLEEKFLDMETQYQEKKEQIKKQDRELEARRFDEQRAKEYFDDVFLPRMRRRAPDPDTGKSKVYYLVEESEAEKFRDLLNQLQRDSTLGVKARILQKQLEEEKLRSELRDKAIYVLRQQAIDEGVKIPGLRSSEVDKYYNVYTAIDRAERNISAGVQPEKTQAQKDKELLDRDGESVFKNRPRTRLDQAKKFLETAIERYKSLVRSVLPNLR